MPAAPGTSWAPSAHLYSKWCTSENVGAEHVELWKAGQRRRRLSGTTKATGRLARAAAPRGGLCPRGACARGARGTCACARGARGVCPRRAPRVLPGVSHRGARLYNCRQARGSAEQPRPRVPNVPDLVPQPPPCPRGAMGDPRCAPLLLLLLLPPLLTPPAGDAAVITGVSCLSTCRDPFTRGHQAWGV